MADLIQFVPGAETDAEANLRGFVDICRNQLTAFGPTLNFDEDVWDVSGHIKLKAHSKAVRLIFSTWATARNRKYKSTPLAEPFLSFAKAYVRYQHAMRPTKGIGIRITALRSLEAALTENGDSSNPVLISTHTLNRASALLKGRMSAGAAYRTACHLEHIAEFLTKHQLTMVPLRWRNSLQPVSSARRVGIQFDDKRAAKIPSPAALEALAKVFRLATQPADVLVSSVAAIMCSAPDRINEVLLLQEDCEVNSTVPSTEQAAYGLRWRPAKGAQPIVKWIVSSMTDVVREAIGKIRALTQDARTVARWYETNPTRLYLPASLEYLRTQDRLSMREVAEVLFEKSNNNSAKQWCISQHLTIAKGTPNLSVAFADVEAAVLRMLPRGFPIAEFNRDVKYSEALFIVKRNTLHAKSSAFRCVIEMVTYGAIAQRLGDGNHRSIFDTYGALETDGSPIHLKTHQFRHYLNTLAQAGGMSQLDIAKWSGRKSIHQNQTYDHVSDRDVLALVRETIGDSHRTFGPLATIRAPMLPRDEFARLKVPAAHTTEFAMTSLCCRVSCTVTASTATNKCA